MVGARRSASPIVLCGSLSLHPVAMGAAMHRAGYRALGLAWEYVPFAVRSEDIAGALTGMRSLAIRGLGVSMPFKLEVIPLLDELAPLARKVGAVNTVVNEEGTLVGHNTDAEGAARALEEVVGSLAGARCLVLGAGGAARAVAHGLCDRGATIVIANRTADTARALAASLGDAAELVTWDEARRGAVRAPIVVNATSAGMDQGSGAGPSPLEDQAIPRGGVVMDIVYKPLQTALVAQARAQGARPVHGGRMLLHQAARQFELYTGRAAPLAAMNDALERSIAAR